MNHPVLELRGVSIRYGSTGPFILENASLTIARGERVALLGLNGSGKTTLLLAIAGIVPCTGEILVAGAPLNPSTVDEIRGKLGVLFNVPEDQLLFPRVIDDVAFGLLRRGIDHDQALAQATTMLGNLTMSEFAGAELHTLSHGQKQRVALAGALVTTPSFLLLDEPSAALDPPSRKHLTQLLTGIEAGMLIATHDLPFAERLCTRWVSIRNGKLASGQGSPTTWNWESTT